MPRREKFEFTGHDGSRLAGLLEIPDEEADGVRHGASRATALFAHCFTCGKDVVAASRIARALVGRGFAVMRFDFTGLGGSDGDFANTNFSSNVQDLVAAARHLDEIGRAPTLLIGHSLGGTAALAAAHELPGVRAVATIGAPADARHVAGQFGASIDAIEREGEAEVRLAGRPFTIRKQFLEDIARSSTDALPRLRAALLVMHAPLDETVSIDEAARIFTAAKHPKSFVSLDGGDHLLSRASDAAWAADIIAAWAARFVGGSASEGNEGGSRPALAAGTVRVVERDRRFRQDVFSDTHRWLADEPESLGGGDAGPDPYEHLLAALGSCTAMTIRLYATRKELPLERVSVTLRHSREHRSDCEGCDEKPERLEVIEREIELVGELDEAMRASLMRIADRCPVHRTLEGELSIRTRETRGEPERTA